MAAPTEESTGTKMTPPSTCSYATNWTIARGSLENSFTFETSDSPVDSDSDFDSTRRKSPLVLRPLSPDSYPCEIKLSFSKKHEIRQIYVRSTARVYEIYFAPALHGSNEYLCTVHCSAADRGDELLHASNNEEAVPEHTKGSDGESSGKNLTAEMSNSTSEDDWVEIKNPDSPLHDNRNNLPKDVTTNGRILQDFYEATAEICDAEPCITLTLRLASLESKGCVYIDEVYVYADPIDSTDLETQAVSGNSSATSSLMAMFVPTLLQMSRSSVGHAQDKHSSNTIFEREHSENGPRKPNPTGNNPNEFQPEKSKVPDSVANGDDSREIGRVVEQLVSRVSRVEDQLNSRLGRIEDQLVSRLSRIEDQINSRASRTEDILLRFEEKILGRLQRLEDQLVVKSATTTQWFSPAGAGTRFFAPAFSSLDSASSSLYNDEQSGMKNEDTPDDASSESVRAPTLLVSAPEFSCGEDDEDNNDVSTEDPPPHEIPKRPLPIDDALAAALAGFSSSMTSGEPPKCSSKAPNFIRKENGDDKAFKFTQKATATAPESTNKEKISSDEPLKLTQCLKITAPEFSSSIEENNGNDDIVLQADNENLAVSSDSCATNGVECKLDSFSASAGGREYAEFALEPFCGGQSDGKGKNVMSAVAKDDSLAGEETRAQQSSSGESRASILDRFEMLKRVVANRTKRSADTEEESTEESGGDVEKGSENGLLVEVSKFVLDYETPILEVKFDSSENLGCLPLEALLSTNTEIKVSFVQRSDDGEIGMMNSVQDEERTDEQMSNNLLVDLESSNAPLSSEVVVGPGKTIIEQEAKFGPLI